MDAVQNTKTNGVEMMDDFNVMIDMVKAMHGAFWSTLSLYGMIEFSKWVHINRRKVDGDAKRSRQHQ